MGTEDKQKKKTVEEPEPGEDDAEGRPAGSDEESDPSERGPREGDEDPGEDDEASPDGEEESGEVQEEPEVEGEESEDEEEDAAPDDDEEDEGATEDEGEEASTEDGDELSPWDEKMRLVVQLWEAGNNARLREVLDELEKAPREEKAAHRLVEEYRRRLKPDPVAIGLWVVTLLIFCLLTYLFVLR